MRNSWGGCNSFEGVSTFRTGRSGAVSFPATVAIGWPSTRIAGTSSRWMVPETSVDAFGITPTRAAPAFRNCGFGIRRWLPVRHGVAHSEPTVPESGVRHSALATSKTWGGAFRRAVEAELHQARSRNVSYVEVGGWAISSERRCTTEAARTALATYSLARVLGGCIGITTATVRHSSSSLLRRLGGSSLRTEAGELPPYYDPQYTCEMEVLRFDSESPAAKYFTLVDRLRSDILSVPVVCRTSPRAPWSYHCYPNRRPPAAQFSTGLYAAQRA